MVKAYLHYTEFFVGFEWDLDSDPLNKYAK